MQRHNVADQGKRKQGLKQIKDGRRQYCCQAEISTSQWNIIIAEQLRCHIQNSKDCKEKKYAWQNFVDLSAYEAVKDILEKFPKVGAEIDLSDEILVPQYSIQEEYHIDISYKDIVPRSADIKDISPEGWCKVLFAADPDEIDKLTDYTQNKGWNNLTFVRSSKYFYEILPNGCSKGMALKRMLELYRGYGYTVAACGDFNNDIEMLQNADIPIAPANALDEVKKIVSEKTGFVKTMWCGDLDCELKMKEEAGLSSRCMPFEQEHLSDVCPCCGKPAKTMVYWGIAY